MRARGSNFFPGRHMWYAPKGLFAIAWQTERQTQMDGRLGAPDAKFPANYVSPEHISLPLSFLPSLQLGTGAAREGIINKPALLALKEREI